MPLINSDLSITNLMHALATVHYCIFEADFPISELNSAPDKKE